MTGTPFCLLPVTSLNTLAIGDGKMGKITQSLLDQWSKNVGVDIKKQIVDYSQEVEALKTNAPSPYQFKS